VTFAPSFSVVGLARTDITAGPSPFYYFTSVTWIDLMDLSAGSCPPTPMGPRTRAGSKQKSIWSGTVSPSTGAAPHRATVPRATSTTRPATGLSGSFESLRDNDHNDNDADLASSPVLLSNPGDVGDTPATGNATASSGSDSAVRSGTVGSTAMPGTTARDMPDVLDDVAVSGTILAALLSVTSTMEAGLKALDSAICSLHEEVRSNHGHVTKRLIKPLEGRVAALKEQTARLEDGLTAKGTALLMTVEELHGTAAHIAAAVDYATKDFGSWLSALEDSCRGSSSASPVSHTPMDSPTFDNPLVAPSTNDANANSRVAWARVHNWVTLPHIPLSTCHQGPHLRQTTLPGAFQPRRSPGHIDKNSVPEASDQAGVSPTPRCVNPTLPMPSPTPASDSVTVGGPIISPGNWDKETQAWSLGASRFDATHLACSAYHVNKDGVATLTEDIIHRGFTRIKASADNVVVCYNDIKWVHQKVQGLWYNSSSHTFGPQVDRILQKSLPVFPHLALTNTGKVITIYNWLQEISMTHMLALLPFDAIMLQYQFEGLCPPSLGLTRYGAMSKALMELLPWLIPGSTSSQINAALVSVCYDSNNRYDYLWRVLKLTVLGFDPANSISVPVWSGADDIFSFAQDFLLYFRLQEKLNFHFDDCHRSNIFLWAIQTSEFADTATVLQTQINSFRFEYDDGFLPPHLRLHGLATSIHQNTQARLTGIACPCTHMVTGNLSQIQGLPTSFRISRGDLPHRDNKSGRFCDNGGSFNDGFNGDSSRGSIGCSHNHGTPHERGCPASSGWLARPDRNQRPFLEGVQCVACGSRGQAM
jgi:hypothetical protein